MTYININGKKLSADDVAKAFGCSAARNHVMLCTDTEQGLLTAESLDDEYHGISLYIAGEKEDAPQKELALIEVPNAGLHGEKSYDENVAPENAPCVFLFGGMDEECTHIAVLYDKALDGEGIAIVGN